MCIFDLVTEFEYWKIDYAQHLDSCCLRKFSSSLKAAQEEKELEKLFIKEVNFKENFGKYCLPRIREAIWMVMEKPSSSIWAKVNTQFINIRFFL